MRLYTLEELLTQITDIRFKLSERTIIPFHTYITEVIKSHKIMLISEESFE